MLRVDAAHQVEHRIGAAQSCGDAALHAERELAAGVDPPRIIGVGMLRSNLVAGHALPLPEAAFAQARVRGHVQPQHIGERVRGLQRAEQVGRDDDHASRGCGDLPVFLDVAGFRRPRPRLGQRIRMPGDVGHLRPVVASRKLRRALVGLPLADDVEGHVDLPLQPPRHIEGGPSVPQKHHFVNHVRPYRRRMNPCHHTSYRHRPISDRL